VASSIGGRLAGVAVTGLAALTLAGCGAGAGAATTAFSTLAGAGASVGPMKRAMRKPIATQKAAVMATDVLFMGRLYPWAGGWKPLNLLQRTRQGFFGSNFQPGMRNCIATASSREPDGNFK